MNELEDDVLCFFINLTLPGKIDDYCSFYLFLKYFFWLYKFYMLIEHRLGESKTPAVKQLKAQWIIQGSICRDQTIGRKTELPLGFKQNEWNDQEKLKWGTGLGDVSWRRLGAESWNE